MPAPAMVVHSFGVNYRTARVHVSIVRRGKRNRLLETFRRNFPQNRFNLNVPIIQTNVADETEKPSLCDVYLYYVHIHVKYLLIHVGNENIML